MTNSAHNINKSKKGRTFVGRVSKRSGDKTIAVVVERISVHPMYNKRRKRSKTYLVHDPANSVLAGVTVKIRESRPRSKRKRWVVVLETEGGKQKI